MTDFLSVLIWVLAVCKGYQQMMKVTARKQRVKACKASFMSRFAEVVMSPLTLTYFVHEPN